MKRILIITLLALLCGRLLSQDFTYSWQRVPMDSTWDNAPRTKVDKIIMKYHPGIESLMEVIGYTSEEMSKSSPESGLSNFAADVLLYTARPEFKEGDMAMSLTNFGGIRAEIPKGAVRVYDIYSVFPFDNTIVIVDILGADLRKILSVFASEERFQALGGVRIVVENKQMTTCDVAGAPLDDSKTYRLVTLDFLLDGGDSMNIRKYSKSILITDYFVRDGVVRYFKDKTAEGVVFNNNKDGRVIIK